MDHGKIRFIGVCYLSSAKIRVHDTSSLVMRDNVVHGRSCPLIFATAFQVIERVDLSKIRIAGTEFSALTLEKHFLIIGSALLDGIRAIFK